MKKGLNTNLRENLAHYQQLGWARKALILLLSVAGAMLGVAGLYLGLPDFPAHDPLTALAVGIVSGLAATGVNQAVTPQRK